MKILKHGSKPFWDGVVAICTKCGAEVEIEADDTPSDVVSIAGWISFVTFDCPECIMGRINVDNSQRQPLRTSI